MNSARVILNCIYFYKGSYAMTRQLLIDLMTPTNIKISLQLQATHDLFFRCYQGGLRKTVRVSVNKWNVREELYRKYKRGIRNGKGKERVREGKVMGDLQIEKCKGTVRKGVVRDDLGMED